MVATIRMNTERRESLFAQKILYHKFYDRLWTGLKLASNWQLEVPSLPCSYNDSEAIR